MVESQDLKGYWKESQDIHGKTGNFSLYIDFKKGGIGGHTKFLAIDYPQATSKKQNTRAKLSSPPKKTWFSLTF